MAQTPYCTAQDVIDLCSWPAFGRISPSAQTRLISSASARIDKHCRRRFGFIEQSVTETFDGSGQAALWLSLRPVHQIMTVTVDNIPIDNTSGFAWTLTPGRGRLVRGRGHVDSRFSPRWLTGTSNIAVQYWGGYPPDELLPDGRLSPLVTATAFYIKYMVDQGKVSGIYSEESIADWSGKLNPALLAGDVPPQVAGMLVGFRPG